MENLFFISSAIRHKKSGLLKTALNEIQKCIGQTPDEKLQLELAANYSRMFRYLDFDSFAKIKELYSNKEYPFVPSWEAYFELHNMKPICIKTNKDPIRVLFNDIPLGISKRDEHLIAPNNKDLIRKPYFINMVDIDYAGYFKLLKYLIMKFYQNTTNFNATKLSLEGRRAALETTNSHIFYEGRRLTSIADCIKKEDDIGIKYLIEELGMKPTIGQMRAIERFFHEDIYDRISYYFE